ncbi:MAG: FCD domain-containing protein [Acetobacteraceae bacterium]|nr:FCD domain-containing protein [Acetobacteraceae bacterium]
MSGATTRALEARDLKASDELQHAILLALSESPAPRGTTSLHLALRGRFKASQATIGRILQCFDRQGYTSRQGYRGRVVTAAGREYMRTLLDRIIRSRQSAAVLDTLDGSNLDLLVKLLVARRALEREVARLAAMNATPQDLERLRAILDRQEETLRQGRTAVQEGVFFHQTLAAVSGNEVIAHALDLIRTEGQLSPVVGYIRQRKSGELAQDHVEIFRCVARGDADAAERAMEAHLDRLIDDVRRFLEVSGRTGAD